MQVYDFKVLSLSICQEVFKSDGSYLVVILTYAFRDEIFKKVQEAFIKYGFQMLITQNIHASYPNSFSGKF